MLIIVDNETATRALYTSAGSASLVIAFIVCFEISKIWKSVDIKAVLATSLS